MGHEEKKPDSGKGSSRNKASVLYEDCKWRSCLLQRDQGHTCASRGLSKGKRRRALPSYFSLLHPLRADSFFRNIQTPPGTLFRFCDWDEYPLLVAAQSFSGVLSGNQ